MGTENRLSELRDGMAGRTVTGVTDRHRPFREIESLNSVTGSKTDRRRCDGPSQTAKSQSGSDFFTRFKGRLDYSYFNYKVRGLMLISLITWGLKEVTLS